METHVEAIERQDMIRTLIDGGYADLVDAMLSNERTVFTRNGRLNKSALCRVLNCKPSGLERWLAECRELLGDD